MARREALIGVDVGSSSVKVVVYGADGNSLAEAREAYHPRQDGPGVAEYDTDVILDLTVGALRDAVARAGVAAGDVLAIGLATMVAGVMGVDAHNRPTTAYTTTLDTRFAPQFDGLVQRHGPDIRRLTGSGIPAMAAKIARIRDTWPDGDRDTARYVTIAGHVLGALTGGAAEDLVIDRTYLWCSGLADVVQDRWDPDLCSAAGIDVDRLPRIVVSGRHARGLGPEVARRVGLRSGTPVVAGAGDQCCGFLATGTDGPMTLAEVAGTYPTVAAATSSFRPDMERGEVEIFPSAVPGRWHPVSFVGGGGMTHDWFVDNWDAAHSGGTSASKDLMEAAAEVAPGCEGLFFIPHLGGRACPSDSRMRGAWVGFTWTHGQGHFYRSLLESIAFEQALALRAMQRLDPSIEPREVVLYGGGGQSGLWNQLKADVMGLPYRRLRHDAVPLGAAILAGAGVGYYEDLDATAARLRDGLGSDGYAPDPQRHAAYGPIRDAYARLLRSMADAFRAPHDRGASDQPEPGA